MKLITAMVRSDKLEAVHTAATERDASVSYVSEITDMREPVTAAYRGSRYRTYRQKMRVEIVVVNDLMVQDVINAIAQAASSGDSERNGSGSIFVTTLDQWVRIPGGCPQPNLDAVSGRSNRSS
jgi:nitrogen regulatory protein PII